jgi:hypothetical protein
MDHPSDWFDSRGLGSGFSRLGFQRGYGAGLGFRLGFSGYRPGIGSLPPGAFQPGPTGKRGKHSGHNSPSAKGGNQKGDHFFSGRNADTRPSITVATSA